MFLFTLLKNIYIFFADNTGDFTEKRCPGREHEHRGICHMAHSFGFYGEGLFLANHSDSGSFLVAHVLLNQDAFQ